MPGKRGGTGNHSGSTFSIYRVLTAGPGGIPALSDFDVRMRHSSNKLIDFAAEMVTLSESNLAIIQQLTASMNEVNFNLTRRGSAQGLIAGVTASSLVMP